jgi:membrane-bound lytic murein transglycosylase
MSRFIGPLGHPAGGRRDAALTVPLAQRSGLLLAASLAVWLAACASTPLPVEDLAVARAAVANAASAGADELAASELRTARDKLARAEIAASQKQADEARRLAQQAQVDAQLATAKARSAKAERTVLAAQADSRALQEEMDRKSRPAPMQPPLPLPAITAPTAPRN